MSASCRKNNIGAKAEMSTAPSASVALIACLLQVLVLLVSSEVWNYIHQTDHTMIHIAIIAEIASSFQLFIINIALISR
jgi:hypothetical protein